jgi:hypothetical protein
MKLDPQQQRTAALGVTAAVLVIFVLAKTFTGNSVVEPVGPATPGKPRDVAVVTSSAKGPIADLAARYRPIVELDPFHQGFKKLERRRNGPRNPSDPPDPGDEPRPANNGAARLVTLRLTGVAEEGSSSKTLSAVLEDRVGNRGVIVRKGDKVGEKSIADVRTDSVVLAVAPEKPGTKPETVLLGEHFDVPADAVEKQLAPLGPPKVYVSGNETPVILSDDQKEDVLKKLRARRQASMGNNNNTGEEKK